MTPTSSNLRRHAAAFSGEISAITAGAHDEANLRHEVEKALERHCGTLGIPWVPFQLERAVRTAAGARRRWVDVAHGAVIIEYESPSSFKGKERAKLEHAREQADEYADLLAAEEGRPVEEYVLVAWDGAHISFGRHGDAEPKWEPLIAFDSGAAERLLTHIKEDGVPIVHPRLLSALAGPESELGAALIPRFFEAVRDAAKGGTSKTRLMFTEWRRLFGQVVGIQSDHLKKLLARQGTAHHLAYEKHTAEYLFALNTYIALVAKLVAVLSLPKGAQDISDASVPLKVRIDGMETGRLFADGGVSNMLVGDFFSWYRDDAAWSIFVEPIDRLITRLSSISYNVIKKDPDSTRDLFKGMYQTFVPRALRHALGEFYTPDWLAAHAIDLIGWRLDASLLDPTCGTGTFILEALRRRLVSNGGTSGRKPGELLRGIYGIDLNPLAVLAAKASLLVYLAPCLDPENPIRLPVYLADAVNPASEEDGIYRHTLQTELGEKTFVVPGRVIADSKFFDIFSRLRELVNAEYGGQDIAATIEKEFDLSSLTNDERDVLRGTIDTLVELHGRDWDGIWCPILADRFAAGAIPPVDFICGNPPWVKWSHLPPEYAVFIKERCKHLGVFSDDRWVGGIESDISTVITYEAVDKWLARDGILGFFITGTVFSNESSQGFRRFRIDHRGLQLKVLLVEDYDDVAPFEGVNNHATFLMLRRDAPTTYPVRYCVWHPPVREGRVIRAFSSSDEFCREAVSEELSAAPVPGTDAGPWLKGTSVEHALWKKMFGAGSSSYTARKGITTDCNGVFFVEVLSGGASGGTCKIQNDPTLGRTEGLPKVARVVETEHVFPLLRGRGVSAFSAVPDKKYGVLVPQRSMHGDPDLPRTAQKTYRFLQPFEKVLENRGSYRRYQKGKPYWSLWSTGPYTFSPFKVVWKEMAGGRFVAAYAGSARVPHVGRKIVIPDHKLYFVPVRTEKEAAYLTAFLNAPTVAKAVSGYAAALSLGVSVVEYLNIPKYDSANEAHKKIAATGVALTHNRRPPTGEEMVALDRLVMKLFSL
jgi:hypothetical protein